MDTTKMYTPRRKRKNTEKIALHGKIALQRNYFGFVVPRELEEGGLNVQASARLHELGEAVSSRA